MTTKLVLLPFLKWTAVHVRSACMTRQTTHEDNAAPGKKCFTVIVPSLNKFQRKIVISKLPDKKENTSIYIGLFLMLVFFLAHMLQASSLFTGIQTRTRWRPGSLPERSSSISAGAQLYAIVRNRNCTQLCNCADTEQKESVQFTLQSVVSPRKSCPKEAPSPCWWLVMNSIIHYNVSPSREGLSWSALKKSIKRGGTPPTPPQRTIFWPDFHQSQHAISPKFENANATTPFHHCHIDQYPDTDLFILIIEGRNWRSTQTWPNKFTCISSEIFHHSN